MATLTQCCGITNELPSELMICSDSSAADQRDHHGAGQCAEHRAVAAEDAGAADDSRGDHVQLAQRAGRRLKER